MWHEKDLRPLRATGPLLMLDPKGTFHSRELKLDSGDLVAFPTREGLGQVDAQHQGHQQAQSHQVNNPKAADASVENARHA